MMNGLLEKNLKALSARYPELADKVARSNSNLYQAIPTTRGQFNLVYNGDNPPVLFYDPENIFTHVQSVLQGYRLDKARFAALFGLGLGYHLWVLHKVLGGKGFLENILVIEKDTECLRRALEVFDFSEVLRDERILLIVGAEEDSLFVHMEKIMEVITVPKIKAAEFVAWPASLKIAPQYYKQAKKSLADAADRWMVGRGNDPFDTLVAYEHFFKNCREYLSHPGINSLKGLFSRKPAIVVATGPSLNKNVHLLKSVQERAVILSADASLSILHKHGIRPHLAAVSERTPGIDKFFHNLPDHDQTVLATISFAHPSTLNAYRGLKVFMHRPYQFFDILGVNADCLVLGSHTASACFGIAAYMKCDPIILIGQDLAFGPSGLSHAEGCIFGEDQKFFGAGQSELEVPGNVSEKVRTNQQWYQFIKEYEKLIADYRGTVVNATEGGARIGGTRIMPLRAALDTFCPEAFNPRSVIKNRMKTEKSKISPMTIMNGVDSLIKDIGSCIDQAREGLNIVQPVLNSISKLESDEIPEALAGEIKAVMPHIMDNIDRIYYSDIVKRLNEFFMTEFMPLFAEWLIIDRRFQDPNWSRAYRIKAAEEIFLTIGQICISLRKILEDGKHYLNFPENKPKETG
ncbi:MAG: 6-hydroxymethylpterin diphosphokinase MptE-like protein [Syntrophales bacterium]